MSLSDADIKSAIEAWAEAKVDAEIAGQIENNLRYIEMYPERTYYSNEPTTPEGFDREEVRSELIAEFYSEATDEDLPGLGRVKFVQVDRVNDEQWRVLEINGEYYLISIYYSSYAEDENWHDEGNFVRVAPVHVYKTEYRLI